MKTSYRQWFAFYIMGQRVRIYNAFLGSFHLLWEYAQDHALSFSVCCNIIELKILRDLFKGWIDA